jgi:sugar/nucleoside kinase (ribokinase family)
MPPTLFIGRATLDVLYSLHHFPPEDTKTFAQAMHVAPGGPAANAAITHALLGGNSTLMAAIGGGPWAEPLRIQLNQLGIRLIDLAADTAYENPLTTVLINEADATRTIVNPPPSLVALNRQAAWNPDWGGTPLRVLTDGFHLDETLPLLHTLRTGGAEICLDGGSWKPFTEDLAGMLTAAICSERFSVPGRPHDPEATIAWFAERGVPLIAITRGARPILGWERGRRFEIEIAKINTVDTTGAGDVLHGAFCFHWAQTAHFESALRLAAEAATRSCRELGIRAFAER